MTLAEAIEKSGGMLCLNSQWRRLDGLADNVLVRDAERRNRSAQGEPTLSLSAGVANNPLLKDAARRAKLAAEQWQDRYPG